MINDTLHPVCDPCLNNPFQHYKTLLVLPAFVSIPIQSLVLLTQASSKLTEKTDILSLSVVFVDCLISIAELGSAFALKFLPVLYSYAWSFVVGLLCFSHPLLHSLVCVERYFAVEHPVVFMKFRPLRYRFAVLAVVLAISSFGNAAVMIICAVNRSLRYEFLKLECTFLSVIVAVNSFTCLSILKTLLQPSPGDKLKSQNGSSKQAGTSVKRKAFCIILWVQINMMLCYLPPILFFLYSDELICSVYLYIVWYIGIMSSLHCLVYLQHTNQLKNL